MEYIDKEKFIDDIKKDLNIKPNYVEKNIEYDDFTFNNLEQLFNTYLKPKNDEYEVQPNDICIKYKINKKEAYKGCTKKFKIIRKKWDNKLKKIITKKDIVNIQIPKKIQDNQSIIIYGEGNQDRNLNRGNIILNIRIKE